MRQVVHFYFSHQQGYPSDYTIGLMKAGIWKAKLGYSLKIV
ncbi:hypothetical protein VRK_26800 [Vibrio sp. MEBiC08052]|nr:hypothetical protein VRK_26800 [Vibrio sp. MEBiC08052]